MNKNKYKDQNKENYKKNIEKIKLAGFDSKTIVKQLTKIYLADV